MFCSNCGKQLEVGTEFCPQCGASVNGEVVNTSVGGAQAPNQNLEKAKDISMNYFGFIKDHISAPIRHGFSVNKDQWINGLITLVIFALFLGFSSYFLARSLVSAFDFFGIGRSVSFLDNMILPMLYMMITLAIIMGLILLVAKMMKSEASIQDVLARFGTFMVIPTMFMLLLFLFGLLKISALIGVVSLGYMLSWICAIVLTVYSYGQEKREGMDAYYGILLTFLGLAIAIYLFGDKMVGSFLNF